ncbi:MAG: hypothetical protein U0174_17735 [Polyangiaceae bacterium]
MGRSLLGVGACILLNACGATPGGGDGRGAPGYQGARWPDYVVSPGTQYRGPRGRKKVAFYGLAAGADVFSDGVRVAKVHAAGFARLLSKEVRNDQAYVLAAVNNDAWVEGWVFASTLTVLPRDSKEDPAARDRK